MPGPNTERFEGTIGRTYRDSLPHWRAEAEPPASAPNIVFIVLDDVGFSDIGCYGSEIDTPAMDGLAANGIRYNNFHVTAMCSPTRACLLTGRNSHSVGMGIIADFRNGFPAYEGRITRRAATVAELLRDYGYGTYALGKWHLTNMEEYGAAGPFDHWPLGHGFNRWYGFHGGLTDQFNPELFQDNHPVTLVPDATYHLSEDLIERAIGNVRDHVTAAPNRPFMLYLALGACHFPHQVPKAYIDKYRGRYDAGWDVIRAERLRRQKLLGIVPHVTELAPLNPGVRPWNELSPEERTLSARFQEAYAGFMDHTDVQIARLIDHLKAIGRYDNTMIVLLSDNGASDEGGAHGVFNARRHMVYGPEDIEVGLANIAKIGSEHASNHYPRGWAQVSNTPLKWYKKGNHGGGIRAPLVVQWPAGIDGHGEIRTQFHHVIDVAPTIYEILGLEMPAEYRGVAQLPVHGTSMRYSFDAADAPTCKVTQYAELLGDRAIWHRGWKAVARHVKGADFDADCWELYHLDEDFSEMNDLGSAHPEKLREMVDLWWAEAKHHGVFPLDDRGWERVGARLKMKAAPQTTLYPGMARLDRLVAPDITDRSYSIRADVEISNDGADGVLFAWGSRFGGMVLFIQDGKPKLEYVYSESVVHHLQGVNRLTAGGHCIGFRFERTGQFSGRGTLLVDDVRVDEARIAKTWPTYGIVGGLTCGADDAGPPVSDRYQRPFAFRGVLHRVVVTLDGQGGSAERDVLKIVMLEQ